ncbi:MAG TPA: mechanosensitive ion channel domain-containing protein [Candidatus Saccharimonadales bacterium]
MFASSNVNTTIDQSTTTLRQISDSIFAGKSLVVLLIALVVGTLLGKAVSVLLRQASRSVGRHADASTNLATVNRLRRIETWIILSIAVARVLLIILALYFWWVFIHPHQQPKALIGASALLIVAVGGVFSPLLRDLAFGSGMMAEHWFGVGDLVTILPNDIQGVVERITLRSTRIRGLNGEVIWVSNQNISSVRIAQKGVWTMAVELFVSDKKRAETLIEQVNALLPIGPSVVVRPLAIVGESERTKGLWHLTVVAETAPGRNWLIERTAVDLLKGIDEKSRNPILATEPVARFADNDTEREFARAISNAKKTRRGPRRRSLSHS